jgi:hypothetical protein
VAGVQTGVGEKVTEGARLSPWGSARVPQHQQRRRARAVAWGGGAGAGLSTGVTCGPWERWGREGHREGVVGEERAEGRSRGRGGGEEGVEP